MTKLLKTLLVITVLNLVLGSSMMAFAQDSEAYPEVANPFGDVVEEEEEFPALELAEEEEEEEEEVVVTTTEPEEEETHNAAEEDQSLPQSGPATNFLLLLAVISLGSGYILTAKRD